MKKENQKFVTREIACLHADVIENFELHSPTLPGISIPRGKSRQFLAQRGMIAQITFSTSWDEDTMKKEISSLFKDCFEPDDQDIDFIYLSTIEGSKVLQKTKVSKHFVWNARAVVSLSRRTFYILVHPQYSLKSINIIPKINENVTRECDDNDGQSPSQPQVRQQSFSIFFINTSK